MSTQEKIYVNFTVTGDANRQALAQLIQKRISALDGVSAAATPQEPRLMGAEIVAGIAVTVVVIKGTTELVAAVNKLIPEVKTMIQEWRGLKEAFFEARRTNVAIQDMDEIKIRELYG